MESKILVFIFLCVNLFASTLCQFGLYGPPNVPYQRLNNYDNGFVAASKGDPPPCDVKPGVTYCENLKHYPYGTIINAIKNSPMDISKILIDESFDNAPDFGFLNDASEVVTEKNLPDDNFLKSLKRDERSNSDFFLNQTFLRTKKSSLTKKFTTNQTVSSRRKRQSTDGLSSMTIPTCKYTRRYIYPQAAKCARTGEWMYVVNMREFGGKTLSQMIKTEVCDKDVVGSPCMGDCSNSNMPFGTSSICEQHYLQKRLVAISATDTTLISEMFWLPTCCICRSFRML